MNRKNISLALVVVAILVTSALIISLSSNTGIEDERSLFTTIFANSASMDVDEPSGLLLAQEQAIGLNTSVIEIGDVNATKILDNLKYGCVVEWNDNGSEVWLSLLLRFPVPKRFIYNLSGTNHQALDLSGYEANVSFNVDVLHNSSFVFKIITPAWVLQDTIMQPSWWVSKSGYGNESFVLSTLVAESEYYAPVVENGEVLIKFSLVIDGYVGYLTHCLIDLAFIEIWRV